ncbi:hypothetical protein GpartN1_g1218.t1 [Galdieria partita]|uniref:GH15-like domain-containing protein n=1 Tax=Galdieria partita TaxID=83374 RepID=A0A9C7UNJ8_9RHOD|nr:hypothetical protein GpartN1_g1218.t1 [Galdieria partita]
MMEKYSCYKYFFIFICIRQVVVFVQGISHCSVEDATTDPQQYPKAEALPGMQISNWKNMILTWASTTDCRNGPIARVAGPNSWRISDDWSQTLINFDTFAVRYGSSLDTLNHSLIDPKLWKGSEAVGKAGMLCSTRGEFLATYDMYDTEQLPFLVTTSFFLPVGEQFYLKKITVTNQSPSRICLKLLSILENGLKGSDFGPLSCPVQAKQSNDSTYFHIDMAKCGSFHIGGGEFLESKSFRTSTQVGPATGSNSAFSVFQLYSDGNGVSSITEDVHVQAASVFLLELNANESKEVYSFRAAATDERTLWNTMKRACEKSAQEWIEYTGKSYEKWLQSGIRPNICSEPGQGFKNGNDCLDPDAEELFTKSLILLKNSQNPTLGLFASSFHTLYGWKAWMRDCSLQAIILGEAGYLEEERKFLEWASYAELRSEWSGGGFHSTYSSWTGDVHDFVEPQYDASALYLLALSHYSIKSNDYSLWYGENKNSRADIIEQLLLRRDYEKLWAPDFSIWEESSDPVTGERLPRKYYSFTQSTAFGALIAAAKCRRKQKNFQRAEQLEERARELSESLERIFWQEEDGSYLRSIEDGSRTWLPDPYAADSRVDSSSLGLLLFDVVKNESRRIEHLRAVQSKLSRRLWGIARYDDDHYFYDGIFSPCGCEARNASPPWGVTTMFTAMSEWTHVAKDASFVTNVYARLQWMVEHSAYGMMPVGEANDGVTGLFVSASTPDLYEYAGMYIWTVLFVQGKAWSMSPFSWE